MLRIQVKIDRIQPSGKNLTKLMYVKIVCFEKVKTIKIIYKSLYYNFKVKCQKSLTTNYYLILNFGGRHPLIKNPIGTKHFINPDPDPTKYIDPQLLKSQWYL